MIDGDTIDVYPTMFQRIRVRIWGISAPELKEPGGREARAELLKHALVWARGGQVTCELTGAQTHDREVGVCTFGWIGAAEIGPHMVYSGWAADCPRYSRGKYARLEAAAKDANRGIWAMGYKLPKYCEAKR